MAPKESRSKDSSRQYSLTDIRNLARVVAQYELAEIEVTSGEERVRIRREGMATAAPAGAVAQPIPVQAPVPAVAQPAVAPTKEESTKKDDGSVLITSPFVGTFYRAPSPDSAPFVDVGQSVKKGQVLCIVEAMKLMNEIEAESDCKIIEILAKNAEPVEFGQPLFKVLPMA
jgi:acetyl-CoA carboxylase biotin carboxyl carrier protein